MDSVSPVFGEEEIKFEKVIALEQKEYGAIIGLPISLDMVNNSENEIEVEGNTVKPGEHYLKANWGMSVRFRFSEEERKLIADGADIVVTEIVFGKLFTPLNFQFCKPDERPEF